MDKKKYVAMGLLWSPSQKKYIEIGEIIDLDDEIAKILLDKKVIKPAVIIRKAKTVRRKDYDTND